MRLSANLRAVASGLLCLLLFSVTANAAEVRVMISGGLTAAYKVLVPEFERATGHTVVTAYGPSMGTTVNAIPVRLERGEPADVLIMVGYALKDLADKGKVIPDSRVDLVKSPIGIAVKSGAPKPDISTADALKRALLAAKTDIVGPLPDELQRITVFSAGIATVSKEPDAGRALIKFLASSAARDAIVKSGMDPIPASATN
jgi:molybdate transport system substrate-binding protein